MKRIFGYPACLRRVCAIVLALAMVLLWAPCHAESSVDNDGIVLIANPSVGVDEVSIDTVKNIYTLKLRHWDNNQPISAFTFDRSNAIYKDFSHKILGISAYQLSRLWSRITYTGLGDVPTPVASPEEMIRYVSKTPHSIGYLRRAQLPVGNDEIRVLRLKNPQ